MKIQWKEGLICILVPLTVGNLSALFAGNSMEAFQSFNQPFLSPPGWVFPVVWTILYIFMGIASCFVLSSGKPSRTALVFYGIQLAVNFFWSIFFFTFEWYLFSFIWLILLWILILITTVLFYQISKPAGRLMLPYLLWVTFAGYLNLAIFLLNKKI